MPLIILGLCALALYGAYHLPGWLQSLLYAIIGFFFLCAVAGFVWQLIKRAVSPVVRAPTQAVDTGLQSRQETGAPPAAHNSTNTVPPAPPRPDQQSIRRDAEEAALFEDEFLR